MVCEKSVEIGEICGRQLSAQCAKEQAGCFYSPTDLSDKHRCHADCLSITQIAPSARQLDTETMRVALSKNTDFTDAHGWVFSRIVYSCSAAYCLGFDAPPARRMNLYFLLHSVMANDMSAKVMPTMHTPNQLARFHTYPAQNVPSEPPIT